MSALTTLAALGLLVIGQAGGEPATEVLTAEPVAPAAVEPDAPVATPGEWHEADLADTEPPAGPADGRIELGRPWSRGQAYVLPQGRAELGVFTPLRYGWHDDLEVSTYPLLDILMPNLALKKVWTSVAGGVLSTRHNLMYPTGLLVALSRAGTGGILPHETRVPSIIALDNELLFTRPLAGRHSVTGKVGLMLAESFGRDTLPTIDLPIVFPRTAAFTKHASGDLGVAVQGPIWGPLAYVVDADLFLIPDRTSTVAAEGSGLIVWQATEGFRAQLGARLAYAELPFGSMWGWVPLADAIWAF